MMIEIAATTTETRRYYTLTTEKMTMTVSVGKYCTHVCVHNAAAKLNRNLGGKVFHGANVLDLASAAYKSTASKAMIEMVRQAERALVTPPMDMTAN